MTGSDPFPFAIDAALRGEAESRLLEQLDYLYDRQPQCVVALGGGASGAAQAMKRRWPKAEALALDADAAAVQEANRQAGFFKRLLGRDVQRILADKRALPLAAASAEVLFASLCLRWDDDLPALLAGFRRVLRPGGLLLCSGFLDIGRFGDALLAAGFRDPVLDRDEFDTAAGAVEVASAMAWAPQPGAPIREGGHEVAAVPLSSIPIRRKQP